MVLCAIPLLAMICQRFRSRALWGAPSTGACGVGDYPTPDLSRRESGSRSACEKSEQLGPDGAPGNVTPLAEANFNHDARAARVVVKSFAETLVLVPLDATDPFALPCGHQFHNDCARDWVALKREEACCPYCRVNLFS